jgi:Uncharacterized protein conserved in bacteria
MVRTHASRAMMVLLSLILSVAFFSCGLKKAKDDTVGVRNWLIVPVFYATNREYIGKDGSIVYSGEPNKSGLLFGVKNIAVPAAPPFAPTPEKCKQMNWQAVLQDKRNVGKAPDVAPEKCPLKDKLFEREEIVKSFESYKNASGSQDSIIFVHGCCANFDSSMQRAAKISAHLGSPVLLYDWVSPVGFSRYLQNETRVQQTMDDFCRFLGNVEKISDPATITLLGHSMGAMFVDQAMVRRAIKSECAPLKQFHEIIMSNGDVDAKSFLKHEAEFAGNGSTVRIYISTDDDRLGASATAHGGFPRLGAPGDLLDELAQSKNITFYDITKLDTGHEIPFSFVASMHGNGDAKPEEEFQLEKREPGYFRVTAAESKP